MLSFTR
jgi:large subunit ribosomal protein L13